MHFELKAMDKKIITLIPAIRMMALDNGHPAIARFVATNNEQISTLTKEKGLTIHITSDTSDDDVLKKMDSALKSNSKFIFIAIEDAGVIVVAPTKHEVDVLVRKIENPSIQEQEKEIAEKNGRLEQKVIVVTGGAQGFGGGIAEELFKEGANVVIADLNAEKGNEMVAVLNAQHTANRAAFVKVDVSNAQSVEQLIESVVLQFGGIDVMISNAGILRAGGLDEMDPQTFQQMTNVNYVGYFNCAKYVSSIMKIQHKHNPAAFFDIIQINSKSGLKGSNKNFAYAGAKFGGIGLTQSFALELMPFNIKVNSICPGNFFDGPLWSDPEKGLFVQYLNAGKVPGARTVADVKNFYEKQVPAGRGCRVIDVVRAINYIIEQEYETGQAVPVTGGQNMIN